MKRGFTLLEALIVIAIVAVCFAIALPFAKDQPNKEEEMRKSGCRVIGYAGRYADIKVYRCPGYEDVVSKRDWTGPRTVEKN